MFGTHRLAESEALKESMQAANVTDLIWTNEHLC